MHFPHILPNKHSTHPIRCKTKVITFTLTHHTLSEDTQTQQEQKLADYLTTGWTIIASGGFGGDPGPSDHGFGWGMGFVVLRRDEMDDPQLPSAVSHHNGAAYQVKVFLLVLSHNLLTETFQQRQEEQLAEYIGSGWTIIASGGYGGDPGTNEGDIGWGMGFLILGKTQTRTNGLA